MRKALLVVSTLALLGGVVLFSPRNIPNVAQRVEAQATTPDFSGIWLAKFLQSLSLADAGGRKFGMEPDISYTAWGLEKVRSAKPTDTAHRWVPLQLPACLNALTGGNAHAPKCRLVSRDWRL